MQALSDFDAVVQDLEQNENLIRIKKLLVCVCKNTWETDHSKLANLSLQDLVQELLNFAPTLIQLKLVLGSIVKTLNKQVEYTLISNIIIHKIGKLYPDYQEPGSAIVSQEIIRNLENHEYAIRIKKLLLCACRNIWETDLDQLNRLDLKILIQELFEIASSPEQLRVALDSIVKTLNKQAEYVLVAQVIIDQLGNLYPTVQEQVRQEQTQIIVKQPEPASQAQTEPTQKFNSPQATEDCNIRREYDPFDLRLEIMKYTNPLRAKILLFSTLYTPFSLSEDDWLRLKSSSLDDLLQKLFHACSSLTQLKSRLYSTARNLEDAEQSAQAAGAIVQCIKPFYSVISEDENLIQPPTRSSAEETRIKANTSDETRINNLLVINSDDQQTCQLFSSSAKSSSRLKELSEEDKTCQLSPPVLVEQSLDEEEHTCQIFTTLTPNLQHQQLLDKR